MSEATYYESPGLWVADRYLANPEEQVRFSACAGLVPPGVRTLLDVGTGNGAFLRYLEDQGRPLELTGAERSHTAIGSAVCAAPIRPASADALPFADGAFDLVSALEVIEHFPYGVYEKALGEMARVAREHILVSVPYREDRRRVTCPYCGCVYSPDYHMRSFDEEVLRGLFPGFAVQRLLPIVVRSEYLFAGTLHRVHQLVTGYRKPPKATAMCPQCGYSRAAAEGAPPAPARPGRSRASRLVRSILPPVSRVRWMAALYRRAQ